MLQSTSGANYKSLALIDAAKRGDIDLVTAILNERSVAIYQFDCTAQLSNASLTYADINGADSLGCTALHRAVENNHSQIVEKLLNSPTMRINPVDNEGETPLHIAAKLGLADMVTQLRVAGANLFATNKWGETALHLAALYGHECVIERFIAMRMNLDVANHQGQTPLHYLVFDSHFSGLLIAAGANVNAINNNGLSVLHTAVSSILLNAKIAPSTANNSNISPLIAAGAHINPDYIFKNHDEFWKLYKIILKSIRNKDTYSSREIAIVNNFEKIRWQQQIQLTSPLTEKEQATIDRCKPRLAALSKMLADLTIASSSNVDDSDAISNNAAPIIIARVKNVREATAIKSRMKKLHRTSCEK